MVGGRSIMCSRGAVWRRGVKSGKVRLVPTVAQRDRAIIADRAAGMSLRAIASKHGLKLGGRCSSFYGATLRGCSGGGVL